MAHELGGTPPLLPGLDSQDLSGRSTSCSAPLRPAIDAADQTLWGESAEATSPACSRPPLHTPLLVFRRLSSSAGRRSNTSSRATAATATSCTCTSRRAPATGRTKEGTTSEHSDATPRRGSHRRRFHLAPLQKFGRSLMLPIAVLPAAGCCSGSASPTCSARTARLGAGRGRRRRGRRRDLRQPAAALRGRHRDRHGQEGRRLDRAGCRRRLPGLQGRRRRDVAVRARPARRGRRRS